MYRLNEGDYKETASALCTDIDGNELVEVCDIFMSGESTVDLLLDEAIQTYITENYGNFTQPECSTFPRCRFNLLGDALTPASR